MGLVLAHSGDSPLWLAVGTGLLIWGGSTGRLWGFCIVAANLVGAGTAAVLKWCFRRSRPAPSVGWLYTRLDRLAFPSGHATRTACMAVMLAPLLPGWARAGVWVWTVGVWLARVALQVHHLSDVVAGGALGVILGFVLRTSCLPAHP